MILILGTAAWAHNSKAWQERLDARTATLWIEGQDIGDGIVLNSRGELNVTWIERGLVRYLNRDRDVEEWVFDSLNYYSSNRKDTQAKVKGRDVLVLRFRAVKYWNFSPTKLVVGDYSVTSDDILTKREYWDQGELTPGHVGIVAVCVPSFKAGQKIDLSYEDSLTVFEVPAK